MAGQAGEMEEWRKLAGGTVLAALAVFPAPLLAGPNAARPQRNSPSPAARRVSTMKSGVLPTRAGLLLRLRTDLGDVHIFTDASGHVSYRVTAEADAGDRGARKFLREFSLAVRNIRAGVALKGHVPWRTFQGRLWVTYEIHIPKRYNLDIYTQAGGIEVQQIDGHVKLMTGGGDIAVDGVGAGESRADTSGTSKQILASLETKGGHIRIGDVAGGLQATTAGGHITVGNVDGPANLQTGGGRIQSGRIEGEATLDTGGGNIQVLGASSDVTANTAGGQINIGEAAGTIRASTGGGAVHIEQVSGPTTVDTSGGGVFLAQVDGPLHVSSVSGGITAWFTEQRAAREPTLVDGAIRKMPGASKLVSEDGDIVVYLPRQLAVTIEAEVEHSSAHHIVADPSLPLKISYAESDSGIRDVRGKCNLNGGGNILQLKALSGNIVLRVGEPGANAQALLSPGVAGSSGSDSAGSYYHARAGSSRGSLIEELRREFQLSWWGGVPINSTELQKNLAYSVTPIYPEVARKAGVEGDVALRAYVSRKGVVTGLRVLSGPPILARAAINAVKQWRYHAVIIDGQPTDVVTTLTVAFRLK